MFITCKPVRFFDWAIFHIILENMLKGELITGIVHSIHMLFQWLKPKFYLLDVYSGIIFLFNLVLSLCILYDTQQQLNKQSSLPCYRILYEQYENTFRLLSKNPTCVIYKVKFV